MRCLCARELQALMYTEWKVVPRSAAGTKENAMYSVHACDDTVFAS